MMILEQRPMCLLAAFVFSALSVVLLLVPQVIFWLFGMETDTSGVIISRRAAMLFAGLAFLAWTVRNAPQSAATQAIFYSFAITLAGLAALGCIEFMNGNVGPGIALAVVTETIFAFGFMRLARRIESAH